MKFAHGGIAIVALSFVVLGSAPSHAVPGFCPLPAKKPVCKQFSTPVCLNRVPCKLSSGVTTLVCLRWTCLRRPQPIPQPVPFPDPFPDLLPGPFPDPIPGPQPDPWN